MNSNEQIINDFIAAWARLDADAVTEFFTDDAVYHNIPMAPVKGKENIRKEIPKFMRGTTSLNFEVRHQVAAGNLVMNERLDHATVKGKSFSLPVFGVFELEGGKIKAWRDYFDLETFTKALAA